MGKILKGFWDCNYCNTIGIGGNIRECPNCGKVRDEDTIFYLDKTKSTYVPEKEAIHINRNPDWICEYCNQLNSDDNISCISCGAPRTVNNLNYFENRKKKYQEELSKKILAEDSSDFLYDKNEDKKEKFFPLKNFFSSHMFYILITLFLLFSIAGIIFLLVPKEQELTVQELSWKYCISIERYQTVEESDWTLPSNARLLYTQEEFSHYESVLDHYETKTRQVSKERLVGYEDYVTGYRDLGNGYFEEITTSRPIYETYYETETYEEPIYRNEAVYRTKYYYEIDKWIYERSVITSGNDKEPYWGEPNLKSDERIQSKTENYFMIGLNSDKKQKTISLSYDDWNSLEIGQTVTVKVSFGHGKIVE